MLQLGVEYAGDKYDYSLWIVVYVDIIDVSFLYNFCQ